MNYDTCHWRRWNPRCASKKWKCLVLGALLLLKTFTSKMANRKPMKMAGRRSRCFFWSQVSRQFPRVRLKKAFCETRVPHESSKNITPLKQKKGYQVTFVLILPAAGLLLPLELKKRKRNFAGRRHQVIQFFSTDKRSIFVVVILSGIIHVQKNMPFQNFVMFIRI